MCEKIIVGPHGVPDPPSLAQMTFTQCTHKGLGLAQVEKKVLKKELKKITALKKVLKKGDALFKVLKKVLIKLTQKK